MRICLLENTCEIVRSKGVQYPQLNPANSLEIIICVCTNRFIENKNKINVAECKN